MGTVVAPVVERRELGLVSDHELVAAVRAGHERAFERLYERYHRRIAAYVYGMVNDYGRAEDITQDVFISALRRMRETERPIAFKPWIYEIAKNACIDQFRRSRRAEEISYDAEEGVGALENVRLASTDATPADAVDAKQQLDHLCGAFGGLSDTHHQILVMRELEGLSYREIGDRMGLSRPSVESTLFRARRRLTEEYDELVSGERCTRVQSIIFTASTGALGARDQRRMVRHVAHCQPCRREARLAGLEVGSLSRHPGRDALAAKVAAILPFPALLRGRRESAAESPAPGFVAQMSGPLSTMVEPIAGWTKAVAAAATILVAGAGAGAVSRVAADADRGFDESAPAAATRGDGSKAERSRERAGRRTATAPAGRRAERGARGGADVGGAAEGEASAPSVNGEAAPARDLVPANPPAPPSPPGQILPPRDGDDRSPSEPGTGPEGVTVPADADQLVDEVDDTTYTVDPRLGEAVHEVGDAADVG